MRLPVRTAGDGVDAPGGAGRSDQPDPAHRSPSAPVALAWLALVAIGVMGRLWQPAYNVSPLLGIGVCAGALLPGLLRGSAAGTLLAASVPAAALAASNLALPGGGKYGSWIMAAVVYAAFVWPVLMGPVVRRHRVWGPLAGSLAGSLVFFVATNFAHWLTTNDYARSVAGLAECYIAALPFYRWMPVGDAAWSLLLVNALPAVLPVPAGREVGNAA